ncbi:hypothetical protein SBRCBS47491_006384 [Sporothrix bragantina]|uniref:Yippee domain-containing protein n=1 Tax=Sporothrix bragantina TaxID=671064 RepID=A0ABP0C4S7_9PEZI
MTLPVPFPAFGNNDDHEPVAPVYLTSLTAEPKVVDGASPKDSQDTKEAPTFKLGPQVGPSVSPRVPYPGRQPPFRHLQRVLPTTLRCRRCSADLAFASQIVSKGFTGRHGRAYLVSAPASHADHLFAPEVKPMQDDDDTVLWDNEEEGAIWEDSGVSEMAEEERGADDDTASDVSLARGLVRVGGIQDLPNIRIGRAEYRRLVTGAHVVADISCAVCCSKVGWKYIDASDPAQRYKVGKFILELAMLSTFHSWEEVDDDEGDMEGLANNVGTVCTLNAQYRKGRLQAEGELYDSDDDEDCDPNRIEFDSEDEDECEEIFNGTWDAAVVARRRAMKRADELRRSFMAS